MTKIEIVGRVYTPPLTRVTKNGKDQVYFTVVVNEKRKDAEGEKAETTTFFNVNVFGARGLTCGAWLNIGSRVLIEGDLRTREYQAKDGTTKTALDIFARDVHFLDFKKKKEGEVPPEDQILYDLTSDDIPF